MPRTASADGLLEKVLAILPYSEDEIIFKGITSSIADRIVELKKSTYRLREQYGSLEKLEKHLKKVGISPDDHTLYQDLLEWRAINAELNQLFEILQAS
ncbi:hypothetical protein HY230_05545 [Candidatus Acetothermia bacterium]|nr:hypothetical protein [Candidatus Acetothermia bacterium]